MNHPFQLARVSRPTFTRDPFSPSGWLQSASCSMVRMVWRQSRVLRGTMTESSPASVRVRRAGATWTGWARRASEDCGEALPAALSAWRSFPLHNIPQRVCAPRGLSQTGTRFEASADGKHKGAARRGVAAGPRVAPWHLACGLAYSGIPCPCLRIRFTVLLIGRPSAQRPVRMSLSKSHRLAGFPSTMAYADGLSRTAKSSMV